MAEKPLSLRLSTELTKRLHTLAEKSGKSVDEMLVLAVEEYVETWEDYHRTCDALDSGADERVALKAAVND